MNTLNKITSCIFLSTFLSLFCTNTEHIVIEIKRETIEEQHFEVRHETNNGIFSEQYLVNDKSVSFEEYKTAYLNAKQQTLKKELDEEHQHALTHAQQEKELQHTIATRLLHLHHEALKAAIKMIKNYELEPLLIWDKNTIASKEDYEYATSQLGKEVATLLQSPDIEATDRDAYVEKLKDYTHRLENLFQNTVNTLISTTKDTKLLKRLMDIA